LRGTVTLQMEPTLITCQYVPKMAPLHSLQSAREVDPFLISRRSQGIAQFAWDPTNMTVSHPKGVMQTGQCCRRWQVQVSSRRVGRGKWVSLQA
jgi:hypothetical protein